MIELKNISKKYGSSVIFENTSFAFPDKGLVCILGPSGCGKSTLLNLIAGFDSDYEGEIYVHGKSLSKMNVNELCAYRRDNIGFVFQNYHLINGYTALENIVLASDVLGKRRTESETEAKELLKRLGLSEKINQKTETLSGGQKQRIAIARALMGNASVILADEPTGALDRKNSAEIMELLKELAEERLVLVITHDKKCAEYAEHTVTLSGGKIICDSQIHKTDDSAELKMNKLPKVSLWKRAYKNFKIHFTRYVAVALAISIGVLCFALSLSSGNIMNQSIADFEAKNTAYNNGYIKTDGNEADIIAMLRQDKRIENIYKQFILEDISVKIGEQTVDIEEKYPQAKATQQMSYGVMPQSGKNEISISPSMAAKFDKNIQTLIGKTAEVSHNGQTYILTVSGIFNAVYDDCFVSSDIEQKMSEGLSENAYSVSYDVIRFEDIVSVSDSLQEQGINSQNASAEVGSFLNTFGNLKRLFLTVSVLVLAAGIFISAVLLVKQQNTRYSEVGLLSALGYTRGRIRKILLYENLGLAGLSALCGGVSIVLALVISNVFGIYFIFSAWQIVITLLLTSILILIISFVSSIKLVNTEPAAALRK